MKRFFIPILCIFLILLLHSVVQYHGVSIFLAPISISILVAAALPLPVALVGCVIILLELFSLFPPGSMLLMFSIPFLSRYILPWATADASWKFFAYVFGTVCIQIVSLMAIIYSTAHGNLYAVPYYTGLFQIGGTSVSTFIFTLVCTEAKHRP